jgi:hypothetical protein
MSLRRSGLDRDPGTQQWTKDDDDFCWPTPHLLLLREMRVSLLTLSAIAAVQGFAVVRAPRRPPRPPA